MATSHTPPWPRAQWVRTCQSCDHRMVTDPAPNQDNESVYWKWAEMPCRKCGSESLDYGSWMGGDKPKDLDE